MLAKVKKVSVAFKCWQGKSLMDSYGGKAVVDFKGTPLFAELAILKMLLEKGWEGVWVDAFRKKYRVGLPENTKPVTLPSKQQLIIDKIIQVNKGLKGCWDIFAWKGNRVLFVESKRKSKDRIRSSQIKWLKSSLRLGIPLKSFRMVEWDLDQEVL